MMTPRARVLAALRGEKADKTPFTAYECFVPSCTSERLMRERGMCVVYRMSSYKTRYAGVDIRTIGYEENGVQYKRTEYRTPEGTLSGLIREGHNTIWTVEYPFKGPDDYKALKYLVKSQVAVENYAACARMERELGEDFLVRDDLPLEPLQQFISGGWMDPMVYALEWYDNRDELLALADLAADFIRTLYPIIARGPLECVNYGGNVIPQMIGREVFKTHYMTHYQEACDALHPAGKLVGSHFDADNAPIMDLIAETPLDYIEAYDPGSSPSVAEAFRAFGDKALWLNWPSASHLRPMEEVTSITEGLIREAGEHSRFLIGVTEDVPPDRWQAVFHAILDGVDRAQ